MLYVYPSPYWIRWKKKRDRWKPAVSTRESGWRTQVGKRWNRSRAVCELEVLWWEFFFFVFINLHPLGEASEKTMKAPTTIHRVSPSLFVPKLPRGVTIPCGAAIAPTGIHTGLLSTFVETKLRADGESRRDKKKKEKHYIGAARRSERLWW